MNTRLSDYSSTHVPARTSGPKAFSVKPPITQGAKGAKGSVWDNNRFGDITQRANAENPLVAANNGHKVVDNKRLVQSSGRELEAKALSLSFKGDDGSMVG